MLDWLTPTAAARFCEDKSDTLRPERGIDVFFVHADKLADGTPLVDATLRVGEDYNGWTPEQILFLQRYSGYGGLGEFMDIKADVEKTENFIKVVL